MTKLDFYRGVAVDRTRFAVLAASGGTANPFARHTRIIVFDASKRTWSILAERNWFGTAITRYEPTAESTSLAVLSEDGDVFLSSKPDRDERVATGPLPPMNGLGQVDDALYVTGSVGAHFRRDKSGTWRPLLPEAYDIDYLQLGPVERAMRVMGLETIDEYDAMSFEAEMESFRRTTKYETPFFAVAGTAADRVILAGRDGAILKFDGQSFTELAAPSSSTLVAARVDSGTGDIYLAGGNKGSVLVRIDASDQIETLLKGPEGGVWIDSFTLFRDEIIAGDPHQSTGGLYRYIDGGLERMDTVSNPVLATDSHDGVLWAMEERAIVWFDGADWHRAESPYQ